MRPGDLLATERRRAGSHVITWVNEETQAATGVVPTKRAIMITDVQYHGYGEDSWLTITYVEVGT